MNGQPAYCEYNNNDEDPSSRTGFSAEAVFSILIRVADRGKSLAAVEYDVEYVCIRDVDDGQGCQEEPEEDEVDEVLESDHGSELTMSIEMARRQVPTHEWDEPHQNSQQPCHSD